ncbi:hypothetical protein PO909_002998 [Leuciscus waleckii]
MQNMTAKPKDPGTDPTRTDNLESGIDPVMKECGQSGLIRRHAPDPTSGRRAPFVQAFTVASFNVRTLADSKPRRGRANISHKLEQIIAGCNSTKIDIITIQEHRLNSTEPITTKCRMDGWTLAHTNSTHDCHGGAVLYNKRIAPLVRYIEYKSDHCSDTDLASGQMF